VKALYYLSVWLHLLAATVWIGSILFFGAVIIPVLRSEEFASARGRLLTALGSRFRWAGWAAIVVLLVTGLFNVIGRGIAVQELLTGGFWSRPWGVVLAVKLVLIALATGISFYHDAVLGPLIAQRLDQNQSTPDLERLRRAASYMGRATLALALVILALAAHLARSTP